ncbi:MAG: hypothetical protein OEZ68_06765 [Gammaproteobacteria bacterium]|nr:hypothetical protein [Gammaproteobacteria bacterium]MDH5800491.1 hypothetical protein [Gammaproteobacteria bacterium]
MRYTFKLFVIISLLGSSSTLAEDDINKQQLRGLDEQVQSIKKDVLAISAELNRLEEKLLYPSNTQVSFFVSLADTFQLDAVKLVLDDKDVAHYIYSFKELKALQKGGVQRLFTGNVRTGEHKIQVKVVGKQGINKTNKTVSHTVKKGVGPQFVEIRVSGSGIEFKDW